MSFLDDIIDVGTSIFGGNGIGAQLARTAALGGVLYLLNNTNKSSSQPGAASAPAAPDPKNRITLAPNPENKIPVVYGSAYAAGMLTDAQISNSNTTMHFVYTICERTGTLLSDGSTSTFAFNDIWINDQRCVFQSDGITVDYTVDKDSNVDYSMQGLVRVYCYAGDSSHPVVPVGYTGSSLSAAYSVVPNWTINHNMSNLVFAVIRVDFNRDKNVTAAPTNVKFHITNSMTQPGDCIYDYMTNAMYGAGIDPEEIAV
jgi:hypothetical protein